MITGFAARRNEKRKAAPEFWVHIRIIQGELRGVSAKEFKIYSVGFKS